MVLVKWPERDQDRLRDATIHVLNARATDAAFSAADRADYTRVLEAFRVYVRANDRYWDERDVHPKMRFSDWANPMGECWEATCEPRRTEPGRRW
jgi:hypothetical protein